MLKWIEATGKTEDLAVQNGLAQLGLDRDSVSVEVLERAKKGLFGLGSTPARVKLSYEAPDPVPAPKTAPKPEPKTAPAPVPKEKPAPRKAEPEEKPLPRKAEPEEKPLSRKTEPEEKPLPRKAEPEEKPAAPVKAPVQETSVPAADLEERIRTFLSGLLEHMDVEAQIHVAPGRENGLLVTLEGPKLGAIIGHRGETLDAIQQLTNYAVNKGRAHRVRIHIDAENYRTKREEALKRLATKVAGKVVKYRRNITLEPMNAYERHVIHEALQDYPNVITYSTGTEPNRRTVVAFSRGRYEY